MEANARSPVLQAETPTKAAPASLELIASATRPLDVPRANRVYVNRNLRLDKIEMVGFDMDYTLALYNQARIEELSMRATLHKLVTAKGYPAEIQALAYDPSWRCAAWWSTASTATSSSPTATVPGRARHGLETIDRAKVGELYQRERCGCRTSATPGSTRCSRCPRRCCTRCWSTSSTAARRAGKPDYAKLWEDIRECIDLAHRDDSIKAIVSAKLPEYVERDEWLADTLHKFRSSGKRLFLLTNSAWDYTVAGDELPARRRARR